MLVASRTVLGGGKGPCSTQPVQRHLDDPRGASEPARAGWRDRQHRLDLLPGAGHRPGRPQRSQGGAHRFRQATQREVRTAAANGVGHTRSSWPPSPNSSRWPHAASPNPRRLPPSSHFSCPARQPTLSARTSSLTAAPSRPADGIHMVAPTSGRWWRAWRREQRTTRRTGGAAGPQSGGARAGGCGPPRRTRRTRKTPRASSA